MPDLLIALILGIVEGATEFVPVSSTGHLIVAGSLLGFEGRKAATFEVVIQLGAIAAVAVLFRARLVALVRGGPAWGAGGTSPRLLLGLTTAPALVAGAVLGDVVTDRLFTPAAVAVGWGVGGVALLVLERFLPPVKKTGLADLGWRDALAIGLWQCLALWPGVSRSAATIGGAMVRGVDRRTAAEYSFLAAIPVIAAASAAELVRGRDVLAAGDLPLFAVGFATAFVAAWVAVRFFLRLLQTTTLRPFGWYRIGASLVLAALIAASVVRG